VTYFSTGFSLGMVLFNMGNETPGVTRTTGVAFGDSARNEQLKISLLTASS